MLQIASSEPRSAGYLFAAEVSYGGSCGSEIPTARSDSSPPSARSGMASTTGEISGTARLWIVSERRCFSAFASCAPFVMNLAEGNWTLMQDEDGRLSWICEFDFTECVDDDHAKGALNNMHNSARAFANASPNRNSLLGFGSIVSFMISATSVINLGFGWEAALFDEPHAEAISIEIPTDDACIGNTVLVFLGETIPVDGKVLRRRSVVDESMLTVLYTG